jgi:hypothetical protein
MRRNAAARGRAGLREEIVAGPGDISASAPFSLRRFSPGAIQLVNATGLGRQANRVASAGKIVLGCRMQTISRNFLPPPSLSRSFRKLLCCALFLGATPHPAVAEQGEKKKENDALPSIEEVRAAMKRTGASFRRDASLFGGYPRGWTADRAKGKSENRESPTLIEIQPPGTPVVGHAWIDAWKVTGDPLYLQAARETAQALIWCQLASGGWPAEFDFHPESAGKYHLRRDLFAGDTDPADRRNRSSLDDNKTQSALHFLLELAFLEPCRDDAALRDALEFGMTTLLAA